jgi:NADPH2:quinone reductase
MLAIRVTEHGGPHVLTPVDIPIPQPTGDEVLVRNAWIGVNYVDLQHRAGAPYPVRLPFVPGTEAAGVVEDVGLLGERSLMALPSFIRGPLPGTLRSLVL